MNVLTLGMDFISRDGISDIFMSAKHERNLFHEWNTLTSLF